MQIFCAVKPESGWPIAALHVGNKNMLDELTDAKDFAAAYAMARSMIGAGPPELLDLEAERRAAEHDDND